MQLSSQQTGWHSYTGYLQAATSLSRLFSDTDVPYLYYRAMENIFCHSFDCANISREDAAYDAVMTEGQRKVGIGLKTFHMPSHNKSEKIAEFNQLNTELRNVNLSDEQLIKRLAEQRNNRISFTDQRYGISNGFYHCIGRRSGRLYLFQVPYHRIQTDKITITQQKSASVFFTDNVNKYHYHYSKSTLYQQFRLPPQHQIIDVEILENPYAILDELARLIATQTVATPAKEFVILPIYSINKDGKYVPEKSGLNQWNASGRARDFGEVYIPVPRNIHKLFPGFFPPQDQHFALTTPTAETFQAKLCQQGSKALMTNPNKALSVWLLRRLFNLAEGELLKYDLLLSVGVDSVKITKNDGGKYSIDFAGIDSYEKFVDEHRP